CARGDHYGSSFAYW
nr:immunoglobulin heavy chain junction region [Mus musculus]MBK4197634.1 immunoglobulin heavy chain junction region [Mus musculus]